MASTSRDRAVLPQNALRVNVYVLLAECIERGLAIGYRRAHKHTDDPGEDAILEHQQREIMNAVSEYFTFGNPE